MPDISKEKAIAEYKRLKSKLGHQPGVKEFLNNTSISKRQLEALFGSNTYSKLIKASGDHPTLPFHLRPDKMTTERSLGNWGNALKRLGHRPTQAEWSHFKLIPSIGWYEKKFGSWSMDTPLAFLEFAQGKPEWNDAIKLLNLEMPVLSEKISIKPSSIDNFRAFIPPIIQDLEDLSVKENGHLEFEQKVSLAFQLLGFQVEKLGQGTGRNSDGIAIDHQNHYAVFLDAKARRDGYAVGTDDRTFIEYVRSREPELRRRGITHFHFVVVSSKFKGGIARSAENLKKDTGVSSLVMIPAELLLKLIAAKIRFPAKFNLNGFKDLIVKDGELDTKKTEKWIGDLRSDFV